MSQTYCFRYSLLLLFVGCMEVPSPVLVQPPKAAMSELDVEVSSSTISALFHSIGPKNAISIRDRLAFSHNGTDVLLPAGANFEYSISELGGTVDFGLPKPVITTYVLGLPVRPILDRIVLSQPDRATAYATDMLGIQHSRTFPLPDLSTPQAEEKVSEYNQSFPSEPAITVEPATPPEVRPRGFEPFVPEQELVELTKLHEQSVPRRNLPTASGTIYVWTQNGGQQDKDLRRHLDTSGFKVIYNPSEPHRPFTKHRPAFQWTTNGRSHRQIGWSGYEAFLRQWEAPTDDLRVLAQYNGPEHGIIGMTPLYHLTHHHGFTPEELRGFTEDQLKRIHSFCHKDD